MLSPEIKQSLKPEEVVEIILYRLKRFLRLRRDRGEELNRLGCMVLDRAISRTYGDAKHIGLENQAREILSEHREIQALREATPSNFCPVPSPNSTNLS